MKNIVPTFLLVFLAGQIFAQSALQIADCPGSLVTFCDLTPNTATLWNESYWHDPVNNIQDLSEGPTDLTITVTDTCAITSIRYLLFLDLDQDDSMETVIDSDNLPGFNNVQFDNAGNPNYSGGTASAFDERSVASNLKYGFALQTSISGNNTTAHMAWNTSVSPTTYTVPELPYGKHKIKWIVTDACGNTSICEYAFRDKDCKAPTVVCVNGQSVNINPNGSKTLYATDFLQYMQDNSTIASLLKLGIRKSGTGIGFPMDSMGVAIDSITFDCSELGTNPIELWVKDLAGNADYCETYIIVQDAGGNCPGAQFVNITTCVNFWKDNSPVKADANFQGPGGLLLPSSTYDSLGCQWVNVNAVPAGNFTVTPTLDTDPSNGVNTLDLIRISRHILGLEPLPSLYAMIAADVNKSGSITTFDILECKRLLLGVYSEFPNNTSWRFVDANFAFPNPNNPFSSPFPENISLISPMDSIHIGFVGIKTGDVDGTAYPGFGATNEDRSVTLINLPDVELQPGESVDLPLRLNEAGAYMGLQMALQFDPALLEVENLQAENLPGWDENAWAQPRPGLIRLAWFDTAPYAFRPEESALTLRVRALTPVRLQEALRLAPVRNSADLRSAIITAGSAFRPLQLVFTPSPAYKATIFAPQPNPTAGSDVSIALQLPQEESVRLQVTDLTGRVLFQSEATLAAGSHALILPAAVLSSSGVYGWQVQAGITTASGKIIRM